AVRTTGSISQRRGFSVSEEFMGTKRAPATKREADGQARGERLADSLKAKRAALLMADWEQAARRMVARFRADYAAHVGDRHFEDLVHRRRRSSRVCWRCGLRRRAPRAARSSAARAS